MAGQPKVRADDRRGARKGNKTVQAHQRNEDVAAQTELLTGFGMPRDQIVQVIRKGFGDGYSVDTLQRHYAPELERGMATAKATLLKRAFNMAMGTDVAVGVTPDKAYEISSRKVDFLLSVVHGMREKEPERGDFAFAELLRDFASKLPD
jgi:hypothetical protein